MKSVSNHKNLLYYQFFNIFAKFLNHKNLELYGNIHAYVITNCYFHCFYPSFYSINGNLKESSDEYLHDQSTSLSDMFQIFQTDVTKQISLFSSKLDLFITRIDSLELRQKKLEDQN